MKTRKKSRRSSNSLGQWEEGEALRHTFNKIDALLKGGIKSPLDLLLIQTGVVNEDVLLDYFVAIDAALSGVSMDLLSRLLRRAVSPPAAFLPFIARAYEMGPKRGRTYRITHNFRFTMYRTILMMAVRDGISVASAIDRISSDFEIEGRAVSAETLRDIWIDFSEQDRSANTRSGLGSLGS